MFIHFPNGHVRVDGASIGALLHDKVGHERSDAGQTHACTRTTAQHTPKQEEGSTDKKWNHETTKKIEITQGKRTTQTDSPTRSNVGEQSGEVEAAAAPANIRHDADADGFEQIAPFQVLAQILIANDSTVQNNTTQQQKKKREKRGWEWRQTSENIPWKDKKKKQQEELAVGGHSLTKVEATGGRVITVNATDAILHAEKEQKNSKQLNAKQSRRSSSPPPDTPCWDYWGRNHTWLTPTGQCPNAQTHYHRSTLRRPNQTVV
jgi:hypothetical protein